MATIRSTAASPEPANSGETDHNRLRLLEKASRVTQWEIRSILLFRNLLPRVKEVELKKSLTAVARVWEQTVFNRLMAGAKYQPGRYQILRGENVNPNLGVLRIYERVEVRVSQKEHQ